MATKKFNFADAENTPIAQDAAETMTKAFEQAPQTYQTQPLTPSHKEEGSIDTPSADTQSTSNTPSLNGRDGVGLMSAIEHLAARRMQMQSEYNGAAIQALSLKTFPEAGNWKLEEVIRKFNLNRTPGTPKMTKAALAEMILLDAVNELYDKVCGM